MKKNRVIVIMIMIICLIILLNNRIYAFGIEDIDGTIPASAQANGVTNGIEDAGQNTIKILSTIGSIISVVMLVILGIKYMLGSAEERAEYKKTLLPYVIGAILVFAASTIASMIYNIANTI